MLHEDMKQSTKIFLVVEVKTRGYQRRAEIKKKYDCSWVVYARALKNLQETRICHHARLMVHSWHFGFFAGSDYFFQSEKWKLYIILSNYSPLGQFDFSFDFWIIWNCLLLNLEILFDSAAKLANTCKSKLKVIGSSLHDRFFVEARNSTSARKSAEFKIPHVTGSPVSPASS